MENFHSNKILSVFSALIRHVCGLSERAMNL